MSEPYWEPLGAAPLPPRLGAQVTGNNAVDCNNAVDTGWYWTDPATVNKPPCDYAILRVESTGAGGHIRQTALHYGSDGIYERRAVSGVWVAWREVTSNAAIVNSGAAIYGPTAINGAGNGDVLINFPAAHFDAVPHIFEMFGYYQDNAGNSLFHFRLHDGTAPGPLVGAEISVRTPAANPGNPLNVKTYFVPSSAGIHTYQLRWRGSGAGSGFQLGTSGFGFSALIRRL